MTRRLNRWTNLVEPLVREPLRAEVRRSETTNEADAEIWIYDVIDSWGDEWGISAADVIAALGEIGDVGRISVRLNSPGGDYFEGVAIHNALARHAAQVTVHVDALAASAASVIAMAGDRIVMGQGAQMMIHEARSGVFGATAEDMRRAALMLDQTNDDIASFYARRTGGSAEEWRKAVAVETWYTAAQAVESGLADEVVTRPARDGAPVLDRAPVPDSSASRNDSSAMREVSSAENAPRTAEDESPHSPGDAPEDAVPGSDAPAPEPELPPLPDNLAEIIRSAVRRDQDTHAHRHPRDGGRASGNAR